MLKNNSLKAGFFNVMKLIIQIEQSKFTVSLIKNGKSVDSQSFSYYHDLDEKLITGIDKILKRNKLDIAAIKDYKIVEDMGESSTSVRIAQAVIEGLKS